MDEIEKYTLKEIFKQLFKRLNINSLYVDMMLSEYIQSHPSHPSFAAISYGLKRMGIENVGVSVGLEALRHDVSLPAIAHLDINNGIYVVMTAIDSEYVWISKKRGSLKMPIEEFRAVFSGNVLIVWPEIEHNDLPERELFAFLLPKFAKLILPILLLFLVILKCDYTNLLEIIYTIFFILGLVVSVMLFCKQMGFSNQLTDKVCSSEKNSSVSCNSVLASKGAKLFGLIGWSDIGVIYFSTLLFGLIVMGYASLESIFIVISFLSFPYVFYSIYYQWRIVKSWCPLCLVVQGIFIIQFIIGIILWDRISAVDILDLLDLFLIGSIITSILFCIKSLIENNIKYRGTKNILNKLKHSEQVKSAFFETTPMNTDMITKIIFFPEEKNIISFVFSPVCGHCIKKIESLIEIVENYDEVGIEFIFCNIDYITHADRNISNYLVEKYIESPDNFIKSLKEYAKRYPRSRNELENYQSASSTSAQAEAIINSHNYWCHMNKITGTPAIFLNNRKLSEYYDLDDIIYMIH